MSWFLVPLLYLGLALGATWVSWRHSVGLVGAVLAMCSIVTTVTCYGTSFGTRVGLEVAQAVAIVNTARIAYMTTDCRLCVGVVLLAVLDLAFVALIATGIADRDQYGLGTNVVFAVQCLLVGYPGVRDAVVGLRTSGRLSRVVGGRRTAGDAS